MDHNDGEETQTRFVQAVRGMLARPDYLIPLAAAERQFRDHYYGLNSAALLEDLFFDALGSYLRQVDPDVELTRPPTGQKGWDYALDDLRISHKVSQGLDAIAALWDATRQDVQSWSFDEPIVYVLGKNHPSTSLRVDVAGVSLTCRSLADLGRPYDLAGRAVLVVRWPADGGRARVLELLRSEPGQTAATTISFARIWGHVAAHVGAGGAANEIDVLVVNRVLRPMEEELIRADGLPIDAEISVRFRGGVYVLPRELLQGLEVTTNNRAILIPRSTVQELLVAAASRGLFAPIPLWYWPYAADRPPDMYSSQRVEYDRRFSARGSAD